MKHPGLLTPFLALLVLAAPASPAGIELPLRPSGARWLAGALRTAPIVNLDATGAVETLIGDLAPPAAGTPQQRAAAFLADQLGLPVGSKGDETLEVVRVLDAGSSVHVTFEHRVASFPVRNEEVQVHLGPGGRVEALTGAYHPARAPRAEPLIDVTEAIARAVTHVGATALHAAPASARVWVATAGALEPAHEVQLASRHPEGDFVVLVDARDGAIRGVEDRLVHAFREEEPLVKGQGSAYAYSPLHGAPTPVELPYLKASSTELSGAYVRLVNEDAPAAAEADRRYVYAPEDTHFDEVMVYLHLNRMHDYFATLGFHLRDHPIPAIVHYGDAWDNASFSPTLDRLAFGDGNKLNDLAREDNVIYHEYTHAAVQKVVLLYGSEAGAMNEGFADYFAASFTEDPRIGVYIMQKTGQPWLRNVTGTKRYPEDVVNQVHADGEIWGGACWDLRKELGRELADMLLYRSWYYIGNPPNFRRGLAAVLAADRNLHGGAHQEAITAVFGARGIRLAPPPPRDLERLARSLLAR